MSSESARYHAALASLDKNSLNELKSLGHPSVHVAETLQAVAYILTEDTRAKLPPFVESMKTLAKPTLLKTLKGFIKKDFSKRQQHVLKAYCDSVSVVEVAKGARAAKPLCDWVHAVVEGNHPSLSSTPLTKAEQCWQDFQKVQNMLVNEANYDACYSDLRADTTSFSALQSIGQNGVPRQPGDALSVPKLIEKGRTTLATFSDKAQELATITNGKFIECSLKSEKRCTEKAEADYNGDVMRVVDVVRASIVFPDVASLVKAFDHIPKLFDKVVRVKNRFVGDSVSGGYRDVKINPEVNGKVCELQLHLKAFMEASDEGSHEVYEWARSLPVSFGTSIRDPFDVFGKLNATDMVQLIAILTKASEGGVRVRVRGPRARHKKAQQVHL